MDYKEIKEIIKLMSESNLTSLEIEAQEFNIKMKKGQQNEAVSIVEEKNSDIHKNEIMQEVSLENSNLSTEKQKDTVLEPKTNDNIITIKSPIVGTFYSSPSPDEDAFVKKGSKIKKGEPLCIIEAMKLMNEIEAEDDYEVVEILVSNEEMVEYGQPLFSVTKL